MLKLLIHGAGGKMGRVLADLAQQGDSFQVVAGIDAFVAEGASFDFPVFKSLEECNVKADVLIDFSRAAALKGILSYAAQHDELPVVLASTGYTQGDLERIDRAAGHVPIFQSANMSTGVNLMADLLKTCAAALGNECDIEIVEAHHRAKEDAPSGTALVLANAINSAYRGGKEYIYGRHSHSGARHGTEIGIHAVRGGTVVGEHTAMFLWNDERLEVKHTAQTRSIFASGALKAAAFMAGKPAGLYGMQDLLAEHSQVTRVIAEHGVAMVLVHGLNGWEQAVTALEKMAEAQISLDMINQSASELSFSVSEGAKKQAIKVLKAQFPAANVEASEGLAKLTVEGIGMENRPGIAAKVFGMLLKLGIKPRMVNTSVDEITMLIDKTQEYRASDALAKHFGIE